MKIILEKMLAELSTRFDIIISPDHQLFEPIYFIGSYLDPNMTIFISKHINKIEKCFISMVSIVK
jgi:hypothetical protein